MKALVLSSLVALLLVGMQGAYAQTPTIAITTNGTTFTAGQTLVITGQITASTYPAFVQVPVFYFNPNLGWVIHGHHTGEWVIVSQFVARVTNGHFSVSYVLPANGFSKWMTYAWYNQGSSWPESNAVYFTVT